MTQRRRTLPQCEEGDGLNQEARRQPTVYAAFFDDCAAARVPTLAPLAN